MTEEDFNKMYSDTDVNGVRYFTMNKIIKDFIQTKERIAELEKENAELNSLKDVADLIRLNNSHIVAMAQLNNNNVALRKENAELKEKLKPENCLKLLAKEGYVKFTSDQLTKAKELLNKWVELFKPKGSNIPPTPIQIATEQFLSEVEK